MIISFEKKLGLTDTYTLLNIIIEKTSVYHTVNGNCALFHTSKTAKMIKVILLSSTLTFWQGAPNDNLYHFCCFRCVKQCTIAVNSVINWSFFYYICCFSIIPRNFIDSESGVTICNQFRIRRPHRDVIEQVITRLAIGHNIYLLAILLEHCLYLQHFSRYWPVTECQYQAIFETMDTLLGSRRWPFKFTWRHRHLVAM